MTKPEEGAGLIMPDLTPEMVETAKPQIVVGNLEGYIDAVQQFKAKILELANAQIISEQTATRIIIENEYGFFVQMVKIEYK